MSDYHESKQKIINLPDYKVNMDQIKYLADEIESELSVLVEEIKKDKHIKGVEKIDLSNLIISTYVGNNLNKSKRFYKLDPSWVPNNILNTRCPSYFINCVSKISIKDGLWAEFGVKYGQSMDILADIKHTFFPNNKLHFCGFDSFEGFPEKTEWGDKGHLSADGFIPDIPGCKFYKGWFKDTIPVFNEHHQEPLALLHVDCDIYSSTVDVLEGVKSKIVSGTIIMFDNILSYSHNKNMWFGQEHEFRAFTEFVEKYDVKYEWIGYVANSSQAACKINSINLK